MRILGIESTCDETSAGIVENGSILISNIISSSSNLYKNFGGVVPEIAAREQLKVIIPVVASAIDNNPFDAIAVSYGPGLIGSLLIGVETAKTLSFVWNKPLIPVNHLFGHIYANWIDNPAVKFPLIALVVSGGHTDLIYMKNHTNYNWLGGTLDDACGEAFDKVASMLNLPYPGGPEIDKVAVNSKVSPSFDFPRPMKNDDNFDFSFSGLKTAVLNKIKITKLTKKTICEIAKEFQNAAVDVLIFKTIKAAERYDVKSIVVGGGVAANSQLRKYLQTIGAQKNIDIHFPKQGLSVDNGAMIASAAYYNYKPKNIAFIKSDSGLYFS